MKREDQLQYIVRHIASRLVRNADPELADELDAGDPRILEHLRRRIEEAEKAWSDEYHVIAIPNEGFYWRLTPEFLETEGDGPIVKLTWGWDDDGPAVTTTGGDAFDLAMAILTHFTDDKGEPYRPERPQETREQNPMVSKFMDDFSKIAGELMDKGLKGGCSLADVRAWIDSGKPDEPLKHEWVDYPEDHVKVCAVCGHYYYTDRDDWGTQVCAGKPWHDPDHQTIHTFDPRRSPQLREAQRLDRLTTIMSKVEAKPEELEPLLVRLQQIVALLEDEDRARYDKERVGLHDG